MKTYVFRVVVEPDEDGWFVYCPVLEEQGGATWGNTPQQALRNIQEVLQMTVESMIKHGEPVPEGPVSDVRVSSELNVAVTA
jgi:predicted RNase H-like HicB family nuclease